MKKQGLIGVLCFVISFGFSFNVFASNSEVVKDIDAILNSQVARKAGVFASLETMLFEHKSEKWKHFLTNLITRSCAVNLQRITDKRLKSDFVDLLRKPENIFFAESVLFQLKAIEKALSSPYRNTSPQTISQKPGLVREVLDAVLGLDFFELEEGKLALKKLSSNPTELAGHIVYIIQDRNNSVKADHFEGELPEVKPEAKVKAGEIRPYGYAWLLEKNQAISSDALERRAKELREKASKQNMSVEEFLRKDATLARQWNIAVDAVTSQFTRFFTQKQAVARLYGLSVSYFQIPSKTDLHHSEMRMLDIRGIHAPLIKFPRFVEDVKITGLVGFDNLSAASIEGSTLHKVHMKNLDWSWGNRSAPSAKRDLIPERGRFFIQDSVFENMNFEGFDFSQATLTNVTFINCNFEGAKFDKSTLKKVTFSGRLKAVSFKEAFLLERCDFSNAQIDESSDFTFAVYDSQFLSPYGPLDESVHERLQLHLGMIDINKSPDMNDGQQGGDDEDIQKFDDQNPW